MGDILYFDFTELVSSKLTLRYLHCRKLAPRMVYLLMQELEEGYAVEGVVTEYISCICSLLMILYGYNETRD